MSSTPQTLAPVDSTNIEFRSWFACAGDTLLPNGLADTFFLDVVPWANWLIRANAVPGVFADLNHDLIVDLADLLILIASWGSCPEPGMGNCPADLNHDGAVGVVDLLLLLANWG